VLFAIRHVGCMTGPEPYWFREIERYSCGAALAWSPRLLVRILILFEYPLLHFLLYFLLHFPLFLFDHFFHHFHFFTGVGQTISYLLQSLTTAEVDKEKENKDPNDHSHDELNHCPFPFQFVTYQESQIFSIEF
jgi:hypothetical protein